MFWYASLNRLQNLLQERYEVHPCKCGNQRQHHNLHYSKGKGLTAKGLKTPIELFDQVSKYFTTIFCREDLSVLGSHLKDQG